MAKGQWQPLLCVFAFIFYSDVSEALQKKNLIAIEKLLDRVESADLKKEIKSSAPQTRGVTDPGYYSLTSSKFDLPVIYNASVKTWINHFQGSGKKWFRTWLERSHAYLPLMQNLLKDKAMPQDLAYIAMIESGFSPHAVSSADAVGYWQFIAPTASRYGLKVNWWIDERRDFFKSTRAATHYLSDLYKLFGSWYLTASAYNMGEGRLGRLIKKYQTNNYWVLSKKKDFPKETRQYIPKLIAALLIAKSPRIYGFEGLQPHSPYRFDYFHVPGGTDLLSLADRLNLPSKELTRLNPELLRGYVPSDIKTHKIRIPAGSTAKVSQFIRSRL